MLHKKKTEVRGKTLQKKNKRGGPVIYKAK